MGPAALLAGILGVAIVAVVIAVLVGYALWSGSLGSLVPSPSPAPTSPAGQGSQAAGAPANSAALAARTAPALVDVDVSDAYQAVEGAGTGIVLSSDGEVLTNNHVIEGATTIRVTDVGNGRTYNATVVGYDRSQDIAVLKLTGASRLPTMRRGDSSEVAPGQGVVAVGNAQGAGGTPSHAAGSVTAIHQSISAQDSLNGTSEQLSGLIEVNADIVPGYSGGALVNGVGQVIGMVTAGAANFQFEPSASQGYAIPLNTAMNVAEQIISGRPSSGVHVGKTAFLGVDVQSPISGGPGAQIVEVVPGGPAARAGLAAGDTITALGGHVVSSPQALTEILLGESPRSSVQVHYLEQSGKEQTTTVRLVSGPSQ